MRHTYRLINIIITTLLFVTIQGFSQSGWTSLNSGTTSDLFGVQFTNADIGFAVGSAGTVLKTTDGGSVWQLISTPVSVDLNDVAILDADTVVAVGGSGTIIRSTDGGINWSSVTSGIGDEILSVSFAGDIGIAGALSQSIIYSSDGSASWNVAQSGFFGGGFYGTKMLSPSIGFVGGENSIFQPLFGRSTDGGANWGFTAFYLNSNEGEIHGIDFTDDSTGYAASAVWDGRGAISRTTDGGINWTTTFFSQALNDVNFPISNTGLVGYAVGRSGQILKTQDAGNNWQLQNSGSAIHLQAVHFVDFDTGYAVGNSGTILKTTSGGEPPTRIGGGQNPSQKPTTFELSQNYPNPFNPATTIRYELAQESSVRLTIYNANGQKVLTLVDAVQSAGHKSVVWDGEDNAGNPVSSGIYLYRLEASNWADSKKMILLR